MGTRAGGGAGFGGGGGEMRNFITRTNDAGIYEDAFDSAFSDLDEDYSISVDWGDMDKTFSDLGRSETVSVDDIVSPQETLNSKTVSKYMKTKKFDGAYGVRFEGDSQVMVTDGNHRIAAAMKSGKSSVNMKIITISN
jgi:hypothetical protein